MASNSGNQSRAMGGGMISPSIPLNQQSTASPAAAAAAPSSFQGLFHPQQSHPPQFQVQMSSQPANPSPLGTPSPYLAAAAAKRAVQQKTSSRLPPPAAAAAAAAAASAGAYKTAELAPAARRKKRQLLDKNLPERVAALLPESPLYTQLLEFEARVDAALARKKVDIQESLKTPPSLQKTLRIYVFNTFANQTPLAGSADVKGSSDTPTWSLKIVGRILEDGGPANGDPSGGGPPKPNPMYPKFSSFFKRVTIALDPALYPDNPTIIWEQARSPAPQEGFEVKRKGDKEFTVGIRMDMHYSPEKFKLSPPLMEVLGIEVDTRARIIAGVWHYVKARKLQNPSDPSFFVCDPALKKVFGEDKMKFSLVSQKISGHLVAPQPIQLEHRIRLSGNSPAGNVCYDVMVDVPFLLQKEMSTFLANTERQKEIEACDDVICASIKKIHEHRRRRAFFLGFSQSPVEFINALIASQSKDLKLIAGEAGRNAERERRSDFYNQPWVEDAVIRYLNRKPASGNDAPGST